MLQNERLDTIEKSDAPAPITTSNSSKPNTPAKVKETMIVTKSEAEKLFPRTERYRFT